MSRVKEEFHLTEKNTEKHKQEEIHRLIHSKKVD